MYSPLSRRGSSRGGQSHAFGLVFYGSAMNPQRSRDEITVNKRKNKDHDYDNEEEEENAHLVPLHGCSEILASIHPRTTGNHTRIRSDDFKSGSKITQRRRTIRLTGSGQTSNVGHGVNVLSVT
ncbi:hypothetical protein RRG08_024940 [Elysia crispata]|uniref:Uncharacterized protein n=1 Tax=Elysia crispata TaxID=231223 RepID=A0AAE0Z3V9_9GAST|nr:hypothetical protein RRG08_024940 [Elysia crispata]